MLVYANRMNFYGQGAEHAVQKAIGGWLKEQLGFGLHPEQLKAPGEHKGSRGEDPSFLKIYASDDFAPKLYSWVLTVSDSSVHGRNWTTELGLKISGDSTLFSCVLRTDERSTLISSPVMASKPRVVSYVINNIEAATDASFSEGFVGGAVKGIGQGPDSYRAFLMEVERPDREYPILLVSPTRDGQYLVNADRLQNELGGLAQVVKVDPDHDSYEMIETLGKQWSAWDGSVNIINVPKATGFVRGRYFLAEAIQEWGETQHSRVSKLLAWITNSTNISQMRDRIRPEGVVRASLTRRMELSETRAGEMGLEELRAELKNSHAMISEQDLYFSQIADENSRLEGDIADMRAEIEETSDNLRKKDYEIQSLKGQLGGTPESNPAGGDIDVLFELACRKDQPSPEECLDTILALFPNNCVILDTAKKSAQGSNTFAAGRQLLDMLRRLVTEYRDTLLDSGDSQARQVFGKSEFAATESETVRNNKNMSRARTFKYLGADTEMFRHLKIGAADDIAKTIRVHFHWDSTNQKIVIGYCGKHLPVSNH